MFMLGNHKKYEIYSAVIIIVIIINYCYYYSNQDKSKQKNQDSVINHNYTPHKIISYHMSASRAVNVPLNRA